MQRPPTYSVVAGVKIEIELKGSGAMGTAGSALRIDGQKFQVSDSSISIVADGEKSCSMPYPQNTALDMENAVGGRLHNVTVSTSCCGMSLGNVRSIVIEDTTWTFTGRWTTGGSGINTPASGFMGFGHDDSQRAMEVAFVRNSQRVVHWEHLISNAGGKPAPGAGG